MFKETFGAAVLGMTLMGAPGAAAAAPAEAAAPQAARETLTVSVDTDRRGWRAVVRIRVREAGDRSPARNVRACLQTWRRGDWRTFDCEHTDRWGGADWRFRAQRSQSYRIHIPRTWKYHAYYGERFRVRWDDDRRRGRDRGWDGHRDRDWNGDRDWSGDRGRDRGDRHRG